MYLLCKITEYLYYLNRFNETQLKMSSIFLNANQHYPFLNNILLFNHFFFFEKYSRIKIELQESFFNAKYFIFVIMEWRFFLTITLESVFEFYLEKMEFMFL